MAPVVRLTLNDEPCSEGRMNVAYAVLQGIPVGLASGDDAVCEESRGLYPGVRTAQVKTAIDRYSARCLTSETPYRRIRDEAKAAVEDGEKLRAYAAELPYSFAVEFDNASSAASVLYFPGIERLDDRLVSGRTTTTRWPTRCPHGAQMAAV
jgi:D-amino peptidase